MGKVKKNVKTQVGDLKYIFIKGDGRNQAMPGNPERPMYVASIVAHKDAPIVKDMEAQIDEVWQEYKKDNGLKPAAKPKTTGIKVVKDSETGEETDMVLITFKTDIAWPDGKRKEIKVLDRHGSDISKPVHAAPWSIGEGSRGVIHGVAEGNSTGGSDKVSLYLTGVQIAKLVKYEGAAIDASELDEGEDIDLEDYGAEALSDEERPDL
jgi:hypothetical protein